MNLNVNLLALNSELEVKIFNKINEKLEELEYYYRLLRIISSKSSSKVDSYFGFSTIAPR